MVVHSFMNSMEPPGSAETSQMARRRWGNWGQPGLIGNQGARCAWSRDLASGMEMSRGELGAQ